MTKILLSFWLKFFWVSDKNFRDIFWDFFWFPDENFGNFTRDFFEYFDENFGEFLTCLFLVSEKNSGILCEPISSNFLKRVLEKLCFSFFWFWDENSKELYFEISSNNLTELLWRVFWQIIFWVSDSELFQHFFWASVRNSEDFVFEISSNLLPRTLESFCQKFGIASDENNCGVSDEKLLIYIILLRILWRIFVEVLRNLFLSVFFQDSCEILT